MYLCKTIPYGRVTYWGSAFRNFWPCELGHFTKWLRAIVKSEMWEERSSWFVFRIPRDTSEWGLFILLIYLTGSPSPTRWIRGWGLHFLFMPRTITTNRTNWAKGAHIDVDGTYIQVKNECNITDISGSCIPHVWLCNLSTVQDQDTQHIPMVFTPGTIKYHWLCKSLG